MLTVHHLKVSQSERVIWLLEELGEQYEISSYDRMPGTLEAPPELRELHPMGKAPIIEDGDLVLAESGAIVEYILATRGGKRLERKAGDADFAAYVHWFHHANASFFLEVMLSLIIETATEKDHPRRAFRRMRLERNLDYIEDRLKEAPYFAGADFTAADIMMHFPFGTMRRFLEISLDGRSNIKRWLAAISARPSYQVAMKKAGHESDPVPADA